MSQPRKVGVYQAEGTEEDRHRGVALACPGTRSSWVGVEGLEKHRERKPERLAEMESLGQPWGPCWALTLFSR